jgi:hypothetical protein
MVDEALVINECVLCLGVYKVYCAPALFGIPTREVCAVVGATRAVDHMSEDGDEVCPPPQAPH